RPKEAEYVSLAYRRATRASKKSLIKTVRWRTARHPVGPEKFERCGEISYLGFFRHNVDDIGCRAFHIQHNRVYAADKVIVPRVRRNGHRQPRRRADERFPDTCREIANVRVQTFVLHERECLDEPEHGS